MKIFNRTALFVLFFLISILPAAAQKMKAEDVLAKHLDSIGTAEARAATKTFITVGDVEVKLLSQKSVETKGRVVLASSGVKNFFGMKLDANNYSNEKFSFDGKKAKVGFVRTGTRSLLGNFILSNALMLEEGLLGGTLSTSWALLDVANRKAKLSFAGTKKIEGKEAYVLDYSPKGGGDINVTLYFDKETFRHVRTEYKRTSSASIGRTIDESARQRETRFKIVEDFSDFKTENNLTLPHKYRLLYSVTGQNGTSEIEWQFDLTEFAFNQSLDEKTFDAEAN